MTDRRDTVALEVLKVALRHSDNEPMTNVATMCYNMADAMETARGTTDTTRLDWMLAMLDSDEKTLAMGRCIALGMTGREAIDVAAKTHPL